MMRPKVFLTFTAGWRSAIPRSFKQYMKQSNKPKERGKASPRPHRKKHKKMTVHLPSDLQVANNQNKNKRGMMEKMNMPCSLQPLYK